MLPKMCRKLPCMNIDVNTVCQVAGWGAAVRAPGGALAGHRLSDSCEQPGVPISSQCLPGWVSSYGIAP